MKSVGAGICVLIAGATLVAAQFVATTALVLTHANVVDGGDGPPKMDRTVVVRDGRIEDIVVGAPEDIGTDAKVIDLEGKYLLPGLIDVHVHITNGRQASVALHSGVTTARSMGVPNYADVGLRELIEKNAMEGPELLAAGYHIRPRVSEAMFLDEPSLADLMPGAHGPDAFRRLTAVNLRQGVDWIKIAATERAGLPGTDPRRQTMSEEEVAAVVDEASKFGVPVAAHVHGDEGGVAAVRGGVRSIEHGTYLETPTLALMKARGVYLVPTIAVVTDLTMPGGDYDDPVLQVRGRHMLPRLRSVVREAHELGVPIVAATDTSFGEESTLRLQHEIEELVRAGLSTSEAIRSATSTSARLLGVHQRTGSIRAGFEADLIAVERNPLEDIIALQDVLLVINDGALVLDRLSFGLTPSGDR